MQKLLATLQVNAANLHGFHWNMSGCYSFVSLHRYIDELYSADLAHIDKIAEFMRIRDTYPEYRLSQYLGNALVKEWELLWTSEIESGISRARHDSTIVLQYLNKGFKATMDEPDLNNYLAEMVDDYGKRIWFLKSLSNGK